MTQIPLTPSFGINLNRPSLKAGPLDGIQCPKRRDEYSLFSGQPILVCLCVSSLQEKFAYEYEFVFLIL